MLLARNEPKAAIEQLKIAADLGFQAGGTANDLRPISKSTSYSALISLGQTYAEMGQWKDSAASFERALKVDPDSEAAMLSGAEAWAELGDLDRAIRNIEKAKRQKNPSTEVHRFLAQYLLERELTAPSRDRDWRDFETALGTVRTQLADSWRLRFLEADYAIHRDRVNTNDYSEAIGKLLAIEQDFPKEIEIWQRLPFVYESLGLRGDADRALNTLEQITDSSVNTKLLVVDLLLGRKQPDRAQQTLDSLSETKLLPIEQIAHDQAKLRIVQFRWR